MIVFHDKLIQHFPFFTFMNEKSQLRYQENIFPSIKKKYDIAIIVSLIFGMLYASFISVTYLILSSDTQLRMKGISKLND